MTGFVFKIADVLFIWSFHNGWRTGDWHLFAIDIFHEQPEDCGVFGIRLNLFGYGTQIGIKY